MTASAYDDIAEWYDSWVGAGSLRDGPFFQSVEAFLGEVDGKRICDLACVQGRVARYLAGLGARVVGVHLSARLLAIARRYEGSQPRAIPYVLADARNLDGIADGAFDGVVCNMALMDVAELAPTLQSVARILKPNGRFVFSTLHPCYNTPFSGQTTSPQGLVRTIGKYFVEGHWQSDTRAGPPGKVGAYHHTLSAYLNALLDAGFVIERADEPHATTDLARRRPIWTELAAVLVLRCAKKQP